MLSNTQFQTVPPWREMLPHQTQIKICPYISLGINSHSQIAPVKLGKENSPVSSWPHGKCLPLDSARKATSSAPQEPHPRLLQLALPLQDKAQVVHPDEGVGVLGSQLGLAAFQGSAVQPFRLAAPRWSTEVMKHGEPQLRPHGPWKGKNKPTKATIFGL